MAQSKRITTLRPRWKYSADGTRKIGVSFLCPVHAPPGSCELKLEWGERQAQAGENLENIELLTVKQPYTLVHTDGSTMNATIKNGQIIW